MITDKRMNSEIKYINVINGNIDTWMNELNDNKQTNKDTKDF